MKSFFPKAVLAGALFVTPFLTAAESAPALSFPLVTPAHVGQPGYSSNVALLTGPLIGALRANPGTLSFVPRGQKTSETRRVESVKPVDAFNLRFEQRLVAPAANETNGQLRLLDFNHRYQFRF